MVLTYYLFISFLSHKSVLRNFNNLVNRGYLLTEDLVEMDKYLSGSILKSFVLSSLCFRDSWVRDFWAILEEKYRGDNSFEKFIKEVKLSRVFFIFIEPRFVKKSSLSGYMPVILVFKFDVLASNADSLKDFLSLVNEKTLSFMAWLRKFKFFNNFVEFVLNGDSGSGSNLVLYRSNLLFIVADFEGSNDSYDVDSVRRQILATIFGISENSLGDLSLSELSSYGENISIFRGVHLYASERIVFLLNTIRDSEKFEEVYYNVLSILPFLIVSESIIEYLYDSLKETLNKGSLDKIIELTKAITAYISLLRSPRKSTSYYYERVFNKLIDNLEVDEIFKSAEKALDTSRYAIERAFDIARDYGNLVLSVVLGTPLFYPIVRGYLESYLSGLYLEVFGVLLTLLATVFLYYTVRLIVWSWHIKRTLKVST